MGGNVKGRLPVILPLATALVLRTLLLLALLARPQTAFEPDSQSYLDLATHWIPAFLHADPAWLGLSEFRLPFYPLLLALFSVPGTILLQWILSFAPLLLVARHATSRSSRLALWALAFDPLWMIMPTMILTEIVFGLLLLAASVTGARRPLLSGFIAGLAALTRPHGLVLLPCFFLLAGNRRRFLVGLLPLVLYLVLRVTQLGHFSYSTQVVNYLFSKPDTEVALSPVLPESMDGGREVAWHDPRRLVLETLQTSPKVLCGASAPTIMRRLCWSEASLPLIKAFALVQALFLWLLALHGLARERNRDMLIVAGIVFLLLAPPLLGFGYGRYRAPAVPLIALLAVPAVMRRKP